MNIWMLGRVLLNASLIAQALGAQAMAAKTPPIRPLGRIVDVSRDSIVYIASIRVLSDGRVLANDTRAKRLMLFDSSLAHATIIADTTGETKKAYGAQGGALFPFRGDSSLFADYAALSFLVIDPAGAIRRVMAAPRGSGGGLFYLSDAQVDPQGRVVSRQSQAAAARMAGGGAAPARMTVLQDGAVSVVGGGASGGGSTGGAVPQRRAPPTPVAPAPSSTPGIVPDSTLIIRVDIETKRVDTAAWLVASPVSAAVHGGRRVPLGNPMPVSDAWAMLPDGTIATVREHDYHVDWTMPDGTLTSTPKMPHEWQRVSDSLKRAVLDSVRAADSAYTMRFRAENDSMARIRQMPDRLPPMTFVSTGPDGLGVMFDNGGSPTGEYLQLDDLPDYLAPFANSDTLSASPVRADADGNLWIRVSLPTKPEGGFVYDVVNRQGQLTDRIQIPGGTHIIGFGPGVVYLIAREGAGYELARARIR